MVKWMDKKVMVGIIGLIMTFGIVAASISYTATYTVTANIDASSPLISIELSNEAITLGASLNGGKNNYMLDLSLPAETITEFNLLNITNIFNNNIIVNITITGTDANRVTIINQNPMGLMSSEVGVLRVAIDLTSLAKSSVIAFNIIINVTSTI